MGLKRRDEALRRLSYWYRGSVRVEGLTFHLNSHDGHLTEIVLKHGVWEPAETAVFEQQIRPGDTVVDVGANIGWYTVIASRLVGENGRVIAFEPDPVNFRYLKRNVEANGCTNVVLEQKALSTEAGTIQLHLNSKNMGMHSTALPQELSGGAIEVEAVPLDDYLQNVEEVNFVKIDVEGAEGFVLGGMHQTLRSAPRLSLLVEFAPTRLEAAGCDAEKMLRNLEAQGFRMSSVDSPSRRLAPTNADDVLNRLATESNLVYLNLLLERGEVSSDTEH
jgi:FkbM family methyltransferase